MAAKVKCAPAETLAGHRTLTVAEVSKYLVWTFDPGGAGRNIVLPNAADAVGHQLWIDNTADAAEVLTIQADSATVCTPTQNECAVLVCGPTRWVGIAGARS